MALTPEQWDQRQAEEKCALCQEKTGSIVFFNKGKRYHIGCLYATYEILLTALDRAVQDIESGWADDADERFPWLADARTAIAAARGE